MRTDLYLNAKDRLWNWLKQKKWAKTSEIIRWGVTEGYSNRAARNARELAKEGRIRHMSPERKKQLYGDIREDAWEIIQWTERPVTRMGGYFQ